MDAVRRFSLLLALCLLGVALILGRIDGRGDVSADVSARLAGANARFDSVIARSHRTGAGETTDDAAISVAYLERLRLGLGSPFRLVDEAFRDPRLADSTRRDVAWSLIGRLRRGDAYTIDASVLDGIGPWQADGRGARGTDHVALIERAISSASDPRAGELTVRLSYLIAAARGSVAPSAVPVVTRIAALVRDRGLASADLRDLLRDARHERIDVFDELRRRRTEHSLRVEQPLAGPLAADLQLHAMNAVAALARAIDSLGVSESATSTASLPSPSPSLLTAAMATRLAQLGGTRPPTAAIAVTMRAHRERSPGEDATGVERMRERLTAAAVNEETLVASYQPIAELSDSARQPSALAMLSAAVALRPLAQSEPWFPGDPGPSVADLTAEFGLQGVAFDHAIPSAWRPYYLGELAGGLRDVQRVLPGFFANGLNVSFGARPLADSVLALHDPRTRTVELSIYTSAGTLAHELAHDIDWQAARRLFAGGAGYSTDRAMREQRGALASSMRGLAEARLIRPSPAGDMPRSAVRPAELFAQSTDWLVASALARVGRMNGFLSAVQDPMIGGYAAGPPTAIGSVGGQSLVSALGQMTYLPDSVRDGFLSQWADPSAVDPVLLVQRVLEAPVSWRSVWYRRMRFAAPMLNTGAASPLACLTGSDTPGARARVHLLELATEARARGIATRRARVRYAGQTPAWAASVLGTPPWNPAEGVRVIADLRNALVMELATSPGDLLTNAPAIFRSACF